MNDVLKTLLESSALDDSLKAQLQEAWENKLNAARSQIKEEVEQEVRKDLSRRYETDRSKMVEAMNKFITEATEKEIREFEEDRKQVFATRAKLAKQIRENKESHSRAVQKSAKALEAFTLHMLKKELREFATDKKIVAEAKRHAKIKVAEARVDMEKVTAERINKLEQFVIKQLSEEIKEFSEDKKALLEQKVKLAREAKAKLDETRKNFVERSATLVEQTMRDALTKEFTQFRNDIKSARENHFGRKIFEAFAAEYMTSYLSEGSEVKKLQAKLNESTAYSAKVLKKLEEQQNFIKTLDKKVKISEDKVKRDRIMTELLSPLSKENRKVMEEVLCNVKTDRLTEAFKKHLPAVLNESRRDVGVRATLNESAAPNRASVAVDGNRKVINKPEATETVGNPTPALAEVVRLQALAGIKR
jgi:hypothetical protein